jgi:phage terminase large subunit-like protein
VPYETWVRQGFLQTEPGATLTYTALARRIGELVDVLDIQCLVFDRWRMGYLRKALDDEGISLPLIEHPQGWVKVTPKDETIPALWMPQSINELEKAVLAGKLRVRRSPILTWNSASAVTLEDDQRSRIFSKRKSTGRIDGLVALAMAVGKIRAPLTEVNVASMVG